MTTSIRCFLHDYGLDERSETRELLVKCSKLVDFCNLEILTEVGETFSKLVDALLEDNVRTIISELDNSNSPMQAQCILAVINNLVDNSQHLSNILAREGGVGVLLNFVNTQRFKPIRAHCLHALAKTCCDRESIVEFERIGGLTTAINLLTNEKEEEMVRAESAGLIAQLSSPDLDYRMTSLYEKSLDLINYLTDLCKTAKRADTFLLSIASLANFTFMRTSHIFIEQKTLVTLTDVYTKHKDHAVYIQDQLATILANLSSSETLALINCGAVSMSCRLIENVHLDGSDASMRAVQKAAIALTRLCKTPKETDQAAKFTKCYEKLSRIQQDERMSNTIRLTCLAATQKIRTSLSQINLIESLKRISICEKSVVVQ